MSGINNPAGGLGPILQITGSGGAVITNPYGPVTDVYAPPGGAGPGCGGISPAYGYVEIASLAQTQGRVYAGATCPLAVTPPYLQFNEDPVSGAMFGVFSSPIYIVGGFGLYALDIQPNRSNPAFIAAGQRSICLGGDNQAGIFAADSVAVGVNNNNVGVRAVSIGSSNSVPGDNSSTIGYRNVSGAAYAAGQNCAAHGRSNFALGMSSVAVGIMNNVAAPGNLNDNTGVISYDPQTNTYANAINSSAFGIGNVIYTTAYRGVATGFKNYVGQYLGPNAYDSSAFGLRNTVSNYRACAVGFYNYVGTQDSGAVGNRNLIVGGGFPGRSWAVGYQNRVYGAASFAAGAYNYIPNNLSLAVGYTCYVQGDQNMGVGPYARVGAGAYRCGAVGDNSYAGPYTRAFAMGPGSSAMNNYTNALGFGSNAAVANTTNIAGPIIVQKSPVLSANWFREGAGTEDILLMDEIDLTAAPADYTITLPANCHFWWSECGIILTRAVAGLVTQPTVRFGITGTLAKYLAATLTTLLTAQYKRERFQTLLADDGETSLTFGVTVSGAAGTLTGRPYFKGMLVEDN